MAAHDRVSSEIPPLTPRASKSHGALDASELECTVLGIVWRAKAISAYAVRGVFRDSPSMQWSGSAGAIYPLVERLEARGWLRSRAHSTGRRPSRLYALTPTGLRALRAWLAPPFTPAALSVVPDPLRTRMFFLGALSVAERRTFLAEAEARLVEELQATEEYSQKIGALGDEHTRAALTGVGATARARLAWIRGLRRAASPAPERAAKAPAKAPAGGPSRDASRSRSGGRRGGRST